ncbi:MAG: cyclic nucleotide-binding domain-containing protein [Deltaproteobacteria bacterium]|nr:cyclic nucleotide-binding domain-containing protein [Deltaproteobacteria bacterium]
MDASSEVSVREVLARTELFQPVGEQDLARLAKRAAFRYFAPGDVICYEGEAADTLYVIASGSVAIRLNGQTDRPISVLDSGDFFGEIALIIGARRTATVTAETELALLELPGEEILSLAARCLPFRVRLGKIGTTRSRGSLATRLSSSRTNPRS